MANNEQAKCSFTDFRATVNTATWASHVLSATINNLIHFGPGERYGGMPGFLAVPIILIFTSLLGDKYNVVPLMCFLVAYIVMALAWKAWAVYRRKSGKPPIHSRYTGTPYLKRLLPRWSELTVKKLEPFIVVLIGSAVLKINVPLGIYLVASGIGLGFSLAISELIALAKLLDQIDATIEQEQSAAELKKAFGR